MQSVARNRIITGLATTLIVAVGLLFWWLVGFASPLEPAQVQITPPTPVTLVMRDFAAAPTAPSILVAAVAPSAQSPTPNPQPTESATVLQPAEPTLPSHLEMPADVTVPVDQAAPTSTSEAIVTPRVTAVSVGSPSTSTLPAKSQPQTTPTTKSPAKPLAGGTPILPTGARYGDHNPNVPGRVVRITAPSIHLDTSVYEVYVKNNAWEVADYAAGHQFNSANPGDGGNIVISGHNNWHGEVFRYLENLKVGDDIHLFTQAGKEYVYKVRLTEKLKEAGASYQQRLQNGKVMDPTPQEQLTLITCWPYTTFTHRLIVIADPAK